MYCFLDDLPNQLINLTLQLPYNFKHEFFNLPTSLKIINLYIDLSSHNCINLSSEQCACGETITKMCCFDNFKLSFECKLNVYSKGTLITNYYGSWKEKSLIFLST